ncbi:hypothetical protein, partial [Tessaracoccus lapidicaptus]|uniref:hypothetical protein n=1 Tax=Tessaracoccus lapidicaptus TaxID=1427523 RepID=UPI00334203FA
MTTAPEVAPASFAEVAPDGGAVRASLEADAEGVDLLTTAPEVAPTRSLRSRPTAKPSGRVSKPT